MVNGIDGWKGLRIDRGSFLVLDSVTGWKGLGIQRRRPADGSEREDCNERRLEEMHRGLSRTWQIRERRADYLYVHIVLAETVL